MMPRIHMHPKTTLPSDFIPAYGLEMINATIRCFWKISAEGIFPILQQQEIRNWRIDRMRRCRVDIQSSIDEIDIGFLMTIRHEFQRLLNDFLKFHATIADPKQEYHHWFMLETEFSTLDHILLYDPAYVNVITNRRQLIDLYPVKCVMRARMEFNPKPGHKSKKSVRRIVWDPDNKAEVKEARITFKVLRASEKPVYVMGDSQDKWIRIDEFYPESGEFIFHGNEVQLKQETMPELPKLPMLMPGDYDEAVLGFKFPGL